ncbi:hypothetical protein [Dongshaea marina]|uniref:hypothetical protein n=1 Tax=Dongshaea marina TaxID=2047966 RepID=UPI000D3E2A00|nr:hypothetical protein [Dongshaea marina]
MTTLIRSAFLSICMLMMIPSSYALDITHPVLREGSDLDKYAASLLVFLVEKSGETANLKAYRKPIDSQSRKINLLAKGEISVDWLGADKQIESKLVPIRYPVFRGLLGHRIFITNKTVEPKLASVKSLEELRAFKMIQGEGWADVDVLKSGGFKVREVPGFEKIFKIVDNGRSDLFPRAVIEPYSEVASRPQYKNLLVDDKLMLVYKFPMFFFVSPSASNKPLVDALNKGFKLAYEDGSFIEFFDNAPLVKKTFAEAKLKQRRVFHIDNPNLSEQTRAIDAKYWLKLD